MSQSRSSIAWSPASRIVPSPVVIAWIEPGEGKSRKRGLERLGGSLELVHVGRGHLPRRGGDFLRRVDDLADRRFDVVERRRADVQILHLVERGAEVVERRAELLLGRRRVVAAAAGREPGSTASASVAIARKPTIRILTTSCPLRRHARKRLNWPDAARRPGGNRSRTDESTPRGEAAAENRRPARHVERSQSRRERSEQRRRHRTCGGAYTRLRRRRGRRASPSRACSRPPRRRGRASGRSS